ncbi:flagellar motor switch phosphatase FliY [Anaeropeptidivorans aminofermentans]|jgi:flagellar motor switch protein FliN/FliY|uniref:flagellar motor switch phosphatase FliY n=1 Tax=Anaeropeptidivorans aminofermentans TaxID=2934315 RepID=UPI0020254DED|nr:flagellar motor switch phosphatase FliY [Anaeropeptidivorans aminofermentans]MBE6011941.1 flagellar motor switch phosphatase FliY [Lachnospiraceae bacterium]
MADMLSQEEINALLGSAEINDMINKNTEETVPAKPKVLSEEQIDIIGEVGNINMGTAATTLSALLNQKVTITTPTVEMLNWDEISDMYDRPCVGVKIDYTKGIEGTTILLLEIKDVKIISDLMMGGTGEVSDDLELTDIDLSAIGEAMNQMIGSGSTSLASLTKTTIDIATPRAFRLDFNDQTFFDDLEASKKETVVTSFFKMKIGNLIDSVMMQAMPLEFAKSMVETMKGNYSEAHLEEPVPVIEEPAPKPQAPAVDPFVKEAEPPMETRPYRPEPEPKPYQNVSARPVEFQSFDYSGRSSARENIDMLMDVPLEVVVELGKTSKTIEQILEFSPGMVIELDKLAGEPIDILVNGKYIAKGEVVVIDENFAIRVTSIVNSDLRI